MQEKEIPTQVEAGLVMHNNALRHMFVYPCLINTRVGFLSITAKRKKIRFIDDETRDPDEVEKDTRLKFAKPKPPPVTSLQKKMLEMAGQRAPVPGAEDSDSDKERDKDRDSSSSSESEDDDEYDRRKRRVITPLPEHIYAIYCNFKVVKMTIFND